MPDEKHYELKVDQVTKRFGNLIALDKCSLQIPANGIFGLVGPNGSGKTTLFNIITGFSRADSGRILFRGREISNSSPNTISRLGLVRTFQLPRVFSSLSVLENLEALRPHSVGKARIEELLSVMSLKDQRNTLAAHLSYGEKKQLDIAGALMLDPAILLLDEPTAGLEPSLIKTMIDQIKYVSDQKKGVFIIEHNMSVIMNLAEQIFVLHNGIKLAEGAPSIISKDQKVIDAYLGIGSE
ncbi:MAG: ABC transporter ATP-binding protein, partial [Nitrososphaerales archaeon]